MISDLDAAIARIHLEGGPPDVVYFPLRDELAPRYQEIERLLRRLQYGGRKGRRAYRRLAVIARTPYRRQFAPIDLYDERFRQLTGRWVGRVTW